MGKRIAENRGEVDERFGEKAVAGVKRSEPLFLEVN
jgi:hypothetical protein